MEHNLEKNVMPLSPYLSFLQIVKFDGQRSVIVDGSYFSNYLA